MKTFLGNLKQSARSLSRDRGITLAAVMCLSLGIGTQTVALELVDALLWRAPAGIEEPEGLHRLYLTSQKDGAQRTIAAFPYPVVTALQENEAFESVAGYFSTEVSVDAGGGRKSKLPAVLVGPGYFKTLSVSPSVGRTFTDREANPASASTVLLVTHAAATRLFGIPAAALGSTLEIGDRTFEVIGVLPEGFDGIDLDRVDLFLPMSAAGLLGYSSDWHTKTNSWFLNGLVRSTRNVDAVRPAATRVLEAVLGEKLDIQFGAIQAVKKPNSPVGASLFVGLAVLAGVVLLIASMVVASLFMVRHLKRRSELGVRMALGAGETQVLGLVLRDAFIVALVSGLLSIVVALALGRILRSFVLPARAATPDPSLLRVLLITLALVAVVTVVCGVFPALRLKGRDITDLLRSNRTIGGMGRMEEVLLVLQVAFAILAFIAVGWFLASALEIRNLDLGLEPENVAVVTIETQVEGPQVVDELVRRAKVRLQEHPQVSHVAQAVGIPLASSYGVSVSLPGRAVPELETGGPYLNGVSPSFFNTLGTQVLRGRGFHKEDELAGAEPVVVINETAARLFFPEEDALGQCIGLGDESCVRVVGVVENARRSGLKEEPTFQLYRPTSQVPEWFGPAKHLFVRVPTGESHFLEEALAGVAGDRVVEVTRLSSFLERDLRPFRIGTSLLSLFALLALLLVSLGIYAALARVVGERVREIGVRMALGATRFTIVGLIVIRTLRFLVPGVLLGLLLALGVGRFAEPLLFEVSAFDPRVLLLAVVLLVGLAVFASIRPTVRACRVSPAKALSVE